MNGVQFSISLLCSHVKMSRQNFYKDRTHSVKKSTDKALVVELIKQERCVQTEIGIRKLQKLLKSNFESNDINLFGKFITVEITEVLSNCLLGKFIEIVS